jgi:quercetin dioxygenase-like cupin family protein
VTYDAADGERSAIIRLHDRLPTLERPTSSVQFVATGSLTQDRYGLFRWNMQPHAGGPKPHFHRTFSEAFYVLEGRVKLYDGRAWLDAGPGDFVHVPEGGIHAFANESNAPAAMLILFAPGLPRERFFSATAEIANAGRELSPEEWTAFYAEHDQFMV